MSRQSGGDLRRHAGERPTALIVALCVLLAFALGAGAMVAAKTITGTKKGEVLKGTKKADRISGRRGDDLIKGKRGRDRLRGNGGNDTLLGGKGKDRLKGGRGEDRLFGGKGKDRMIGGAGSNQLNMVDGVEQGSPGNDVIKARNGEPDEIDCGAGDDRVIVDRAEDGVFNCETVVTPVTDDSMRRREFLAKTAALAGVAGVASAWPVDALVRHAGRVQASTPFPSPSNMPIDTFVVLMKENRSFDHYFGWHPDADAKNAGLSYPDDNGAQHPTHPLAPDFQGCAFEDPDHSWEGGRKQYNGGKMDGFRRSPNDEFAIGYYDEAGHPVPPRPRGQLHPLRPLFLLAARADLAEPRVHALGASRAATRPTPIPRMRSSAINGGGLYKWETIWDRMIAKGLSVTYYYSDLPFIGIFGARYPNIIKPVSEFYADAAAGRLPNLAFVDPLFLDGGGGDGLSGDEHPHGDIRIGQAFMSDVVHAFISSPQFRTGAMFVNYDEWGGFFDHVAPRLVPDDRQSSNLDENFGITGFRIPGVAISPYARRGHVSHMTVTHESILKLISYRFGLGYLNKRHRYASNIGRSFDWEHPQLRAARACPTPRRRSPRACSLPSRARPGAAGGLDSAAERAEKNEGLHIGSPEMLDLPRRARLPDRARRRLPGSSPAPTARRSGSRSRSRHSEEPADRAGC